MGIRAANVTDRTGPIVGMRLVYGEEYDVILASSKGQLIRMALATIKRLQRDTQGVTLIKLNSGDKVTSVTVIKKDSQDKLNIASEPKDLDGGDDDSGGIEPVAGPEEASEPGKGNEEMPPEVEEASVEKEETKSPVKSVKESKQEPAEKHSQKKPEENQLPEWAKVHADSWRQPGIFKPKKDVKVNDYSAAKTKKVDELPIFKKKSDPNYWGGKA